MKNAAAVGERVFLRTPTIRDLEELIALNRASVRLHRYLVSPPRQLEQFAAYLKSCRRASCVCFLIHRVDDAAIIGTINLSQIFRGGFQNAYLGYYVGEKYCSQGYMTEAIELVLRYAFERLRLHRIEANVQPENTPSIALVRRAGFVKEGYSRRYLKVCGKWRDHERWAIVAEDWRKKLTRSVEERTLSARESERGRNDFCGRRFAKHFHVGCGKICEQLTIKRVNFLPLLHF